MRAGKVSLAEMRDVFNLGIGMIAVAARGDVESVIAAAARVGIRAWVIGEIRAGRSGPAGVQFSQR
jgi:phosphoribosylformylglycinamidine cyclo-ligase